MHITKLKSSDLHGVLGEARREHKSKVGDIDESRTHLNYHLSPRENEIHSAEEFRERIKALGVTRKLRGDAVCCLSTIVTLPQDYEGDVEDFFKAAYISAVNTLCGGREELVVQAYVHMDEKTPHMHFVSIPIVEKDGKAKLSAKDLLTKSFMRSFHPTMEQEMTEFLGEPIKLHDEELCEERRQAQAKGDRSLDYKTIEEYKATKQKEAKEQALDESIDKKEFASDMLTKEIAGQTAYKAQISKKATEEQEKYDKLVKAVEKAKTNLEEANAELNDYLAKGQTKIDKQAQTIKDNAKAISLQEDEKGALEAHIANLTQLSKDFTAKAKKAREEADKGAEVRDAINAQIRRDGFVGSDMSVLTLLALLRDDGRDELADGLQYLIEQEYSL